MKLITQDGIEIFDFGDDTLGSAVIWKLAVLAKFQSGLDSTVSLNPLINEMLRAVGRAQPPWKTIHGTAQPVSELDLTDHQTDTSAELGVARAMLTGELAHLRWWKLGESDKVEHVRTAVFPFRLSKEQQQDFVGDLDHVVQQFRDDNQ
jgi:hypothetical protein